MLRLMLGCAALLLSIFGVITTGQATGTAVQNFDTLRNRAQSACLPYRGRKLFLAIPVKTGGGYDLFGRAVAPFLEKHTGLNVSIVNIVGNNGMSAMKAVADSKEPRLMIGIATLASFSAQLETENPLLLMSRLQAIAEIASEQSAWVSRAPLNLSGAEGKLLSGAALSAPYLRLGIPSQVLGLKLKPIFGYEGTSQSWTALLRGDIDLLVMSDYTTKRYAEMGNTLAVNLILTDRPHPDFPDAPFLSGPGGLVDLKTRTMEKDKRQELLKLADLAVSLSELGRVLLAPTNISSSLLTCLETGSEASLLDPDFQKIARDQKFGLAPKNAETANHKLEKLRSVLRDNLVDLQSAAKSWKAQISND